MKDTQMYVEKSIVGIIESVKNVQHLGDQIKKFEELYKLKTPDQTMLEAIAKGIQEPIYDVLLYKFKSVFAGQHSTNEVFEAIEEKCFNLNNSLATLESQVQKNKNKLESDIHKCVRVEIYQEDSTILYDKLATKEQVDAVKDEFDNLPKLDYVMMEFYQLQQRMEAVNTIIADEVVHKPEFLKFDTTIRTYCQKTFCTNSLYTRLIEPAVKQVQTFSTQ